ncbi:c-type cytochrome [Aquabacterium lacunae]|nr:c-type cytochrome [Aquabacterium lacunae]
MKVRTLCASPVLALTLLTPAWMAWSPVRAATAPQAPEVDTRGLPALAPGWAERNPLREVPLAQAIGRQAYHQACARCHGVEADGSRAPAPDLRRIGKACQRLQDLSWRERCLSDSDHFFVQSVRFGKKKFDIEHMPAWDGVLSPQVVWSIRSFIENAPKP